MALDIQDVKAMRDEASDLREVASVGGLSITNRATLNRVAEALEYYAGQIEGEWS